MVGKRKLEGCSDEQYSIEEKKQVFATCAEMWRIDLKMN